MDTPGSWPFLLAVFLVPLVVLAQSIFKFLEYRRIMADDEIPAYTRTEASWKQYVALFCALISIGLIGFAIYIAIQT